MTARERRDRLRKRRAELRRQGQQQNEMRRLEALLEHPDFWRSRLDAGLALELEPSAVFSDLVIGEQIARNLCQHGTPNPPGPQTILEALNRILEALNRVDPERAPSWGAT